MQVKSTSCPSSTPLQCPNDFKKCVTTIQECQLSTFSEFCQSGANYYCLVNQIFQCVERLTSCDCPINFTKCSYNNKCLPSSDFSKYCPIMNTTKKCPDTFPFLCPDNSCRKSLSDCPSQLACPIGYSLCPDNECNLDLLQCSRISENCSKILCPYDLKTCVNDLADCPTGKTCQVKLNLVCPDGKCVETEGNCSAPPPNFFIQSISCGLYNALCEDNVCRDTCLKGPTLLETIPSTKFIKCPLGQIKCQDNSCRKSFQECLNFSCPFYQVIK